MTHNMTLYDVLSLIRHDQRHNMPDLTASILPSMQDVRELHALSPPSAGRYALDTTPKENSHFIMTPTRVQLQL